jgi:hypothetical protein
MHQVPTLTIYLARLDFRIEEKRLDRKETPPFAGCPKALPFMPFGANPQCKGLTIQNRARIINRNHSYLPANAALRLALY